MERDVHPPFEQIARIIRELARQRIEEVSFLGGDPCCYPDLLPALELSQKLGMRNSVLSNTLDFGPSLDRVVKCVYCFEATVLGASSSEHDRTAGVSGAYDNLVKSIRAINSKGIGVGVVYNANPTTFDKLFDTINNLVRNLEVNVKHVMIQRIIPRGRAQGTLKYSLSIAQVRRLFEDVERIAEELALPIAFEDPFPLCLIDEKYHEFSGRCEWGFSKGAIDAKGNVSRCGADTRFQIGNLFERDLQLLWETSPILRSFRSYEWLPKQCQKCTLLEKCGGGCSLSCITDEDHTADILLVKDPN